MAEERAKAALQASPNVGLLRQTYATILASTGRLDAALRQARRSQRLCVNPTPRAGQRSRSPYLHADIGEESRLGDVDPPVTVH